MTRTEKQFDEMFNEGGEGYNPIRAERERQEFAAQINEPVTLDDLYRALERMDCSDARESGTYDANKVAAIRAQIDAMKATDETKFIAAWPVEITKARRIEWNDWVKANTTPKGIRADAVYARQRAQGWSTDELRRAIKCHGL